MDPLAAVAIGVLSLIFLGSLLALVIVCRQRYCGKPAQDTKPILKYSRGDALGNGHGGLGADSDFDDVLQLSPSIEAYLVEADWVYDAAGLVEHCLSILRSCHAVSLRLSALSSSAVAPRPGLAEEVGEATRRLMPRVEDLVRTMASVRRVPPNAAAPPDVVLPLAPLLEARAAALVLALAALATAFRASYPKAKSDAAWVRAEQAEMELHLGALRTAAQYAESSQHERVELIHPSTSAIPASSAAESSQPLV